MATVYKLSVMLALWFLIPSAVAQAMPPSVPGNYVRTHADGTDTLSIRSHGSGGLKVAAKFYFANGHSCAYQGEGAYARDRVIVRDEKDECRLVLFFTPNRVHTVTQGECHQWCGARGTLDRVILRKKTP
jgi:hypothetical protein